MIVIPLKTYQLLIRKSNMQEPHSNQHVLLGGTTPFNRASSDQDNIQHAPPPGEPVSDKSGGGILLKKTEQAPPESYVEREQRQEWSSMWESI
jgi:hypothetical protein